MFEQKSDAGGEEVEIPVENQAFMDDFFAQVRLCHITMLPGGVPVWPFLMCACARVGVRVFVCVRLYGWRLKTFAPASTRLTRVSMKSRSSTPPSCRLQPPIKVSASPPLCFWSWTPLHNNTCLSYNLFFLLSLVFSLNLFLFQKHKTTLKPSPTRSRKRPTTPETSWRVRNFVYPCSCIIMACVPRKGLSLQKRFLFSFFCVHAGIERQLESNTDERASADLRIRKSQVKKFSFRVFGLFLPDKTSSIRKSRYVKKSLLSDIINSLCSTIYYVLLYSRILS